MAVLVVLTACKTPPPASRSPEPHQALAEPPPPSEPWDGTGTRLQFQWVESSNAHHVFGASGSYLLSAITLTLGEGGQARVLDEGESRTSELSLSWGYSQDRATWKNTWEGSRRIEGEIMLLDLTLGERVCERFAIEYDGPEAGKPCPDIATDLHIECSMRPVTVQPDIDDPGSGTREVQAWSCNSTEPPGRPGVSPMPWVFDTAGCVQAMPLVHGPIEFRTCQPILPDA